MKKLIGIVVLCSLFLFVHAQPGRWQQRIKYLINVKLNDTANRLNGTEKIDYRNNSPDTLHKLFFHLYWNAFQPNSMMDVRSRDAGKILIGYDSKGNEVYDWDDRVRDRILNLKPGETGYQKVLSLKINGKQQQLIEHETILEVRLDKPVLPHSKTSIEVVFEAQVPVQIRRSGRDNAEGVKYSMSQWYPKMVEYDYQGWNANPYIAREFYGVWGNYDVNITLNKEYMIGATGTLQNANEIGFGYESEGVKVKPSAGNTLTWKFVAQNVHDFVWAANTNYTMIKRQVNNGPLLYILHKNVDSLETRWQKLADTAALAYPYIAKTFGKYPYKNYSFIQGGDGGMEYPMATLIKNASIATAIHEWMHSWYQCMMATNESLYPWMDEGFTSYAESMVINYLRNNKNFGYERDYKGYYDLVKSGREEPMSTHADHYNTNYAYSRAAYSKGAVFLVQLGYIVGEANLDKILLAYYDTWKFKHPNPNDFIRIAEKISGIELQWYKQYWAYTTKTIDYALGDITTQGDSTLINLKRVGLMPMPVDVLITYKDGSQEMHYVPMNLMYGEKPADDKNITRFVHPEWKWTNTGYVFKISHSLKDIKQVEIDASLRMADINRVNNKIVVP